MEHVFQRRSPGGSACLPADFTLDTAVSSSTLFYVKVCSWVRLTLILCFYFYACSLRLGYKRSWRFNWQQSCAIAKMTARCALYMSAVSWKFLGLPDYANIYRSVATGAQRHLPINTQYSTYWKLMFKVSLPKIFPCSPGSMGMAFGLRRANCQTI